MSQEDRTSSVFGRFEGWFGEEDAAKQHGDGKRLFRSVGIKVLLLADDLVKVS